MHNAVNTRLSRASPG